MNLLAREWQCFQVIAWPSDKNGGRNSADKNWMSLVLFQNIWGGVDIGDDEKNKEKKNGQVQKPNDEWFTFFLQQEPG